MHLSCTRIGAWINEKTARPRTLTSCVLWLVRSLALRAIALNDKMRSQTLLWPLRETQSAAKGNGRTVYGMD